MISSSKTGSSFAGFVNGYIAGNLAANSKELIFHKDKISSFLRELAIEVQKWGLDPEGKKCFDNYFNEVSELSFANQIEYYFQLGDLLLKLYDLICEKKKEVPTSAAFILKKIIYHYLSIASTLKDRTVTKKAKEIVAKFEGDGQS